MTKSIYRVEPAPGRVAVKILPDAEITEGGIYIPPTAKEKPTHGRVVEVCQPYEQDGETFAGMWQIDDVVVFTSYMGTTLEVGRDKVVVLREKDIICRLVLVDPAAPAPEVFAESARIKVNVAD